MKGGPNRGGHIEWQLGGDHREWQNSQRGAAKEAGHREQSGHRPRDRVSQTIICRWRCGPRGRAEDRGGDGVKCSYLHSHKRTPRG